MKLKNIFTWLCGTVLSLAVVMSTTPAMDKQVLQVELEQLIKECKAARFKEAYAALETQFQIEEEKAQSVLSSQAQAEEKAQTILSSKAQYLLSLLQIREGKVQSLASFERVAHAVKQEKLADLAKVLSGPAIQNYWSFVKLLTQGTCTVVASVVAAVLLQDYFSEIKKPCIQQKDSSDLYGASMEERLVFLSPLYSAIMQRKIIQKHVIQILL